MRRLPNYRLSKDAEQDLREIARYTINKWGAKQLSVYQKELQAYFDRIGAKEVISKRYSKNLPDVHFVRAEEHFIFFLENDSDKPIIIGVLHKSRDLVKHLANRI